MRVGPLGYQVKDIVDNKLALINKGQISLLDLGRCPVTKKQSIYKKKTLSICQVRM